MGNANTERKKIKVQRSLAKQFAGTRVHKVLAEDLTFLDFTEEYQMYRKREILRPVLHFSQRKERKDTLGAFEIVALRYSAKR